MNIAYDNEFQCQRFIYLVLYKFKYMFVNNCDISFVRQTKISVLYFQNKQFLYLNKKNLEDSRSDGSGDVTITDSGRGGSDEDMHHHMHPSIMI